MHSLNQDFLRRLSFSADQVSTLRKLGEYRGKQELFARQRPEVLEGLRTIAVVESTESSNRLEGITVPEERLESLVLRSTQPENRSEQEVAGYRDALGLIHESAAGMPISAGVILQLHQTVYRYLPSEGGRWKMTDNEIVDRAPDGGVLRVRFSPVSAVATPQAMADLVSGYSAALAEGMQDPLVLAPLLILDFLCIHPFTDGNGRVARLLTLLALYQFNYEVGRYISLERVFEESRETYYQSLEASSQRWHEAEHDVNPWMNYFWGVLLRAYGEFEERVGVVGGGKGSKTQQVIAAVGRRGMPFRISELEKDCPGVSRDMIRHVLRELKRQGKVRVTGKLKRQGKVRVTGRGRGARWHRVEGEW